MIKRIQKIKNIGKFSNCICPGCEFNKNSIVFAFNAEGKSTFTSILRSIKTGNNDILVGRKTFGSTSDEYVEVDFENTSSKSKYIYNQGKWNKTNPNIIIFDSKFINDNIFLGETINYEQQKNLNSIIVGKNGREISKKIFDLDQLSKEYTRQKIEKTNILNSQFIGIEPDKFIFIPEDKKIDEKILDKENEINIEVNKESIKNNISLYIANLSLIDFTKTKQSLSNSIDTKLDEIEQHIKNNFSNSDNAYNFINTGLGFLKEKTNALQICVFCGQKIESKSEELIKKYKKYFKDGYQELQKNISTEIENFNKINLELILERVTKYLNTIKKDIGLNEDKILEICKLKNDFQEELKNKIDLSYNIDFNNLDKLGEEIKTIIKNLSEYKQELENSPAKDIDTLKKEKVSLEITKKRYEEYWVKFCSSLQEINENAKNTRKERDETRTQLEKYSNNIFLIHKESINKLCREMGADFEIDDFSPLKNIIGTTERIFTIKFSKDYKVDIKESDDKLPNFKNTLSESDKRLLAFSFFVSLLQHDDKLNEKIIIFDDPMSSFDKERQRKTIQIIADIKSTDQNGKIITTEQKIILTHEERFAKQLSKIMEECSTFKINFNPKEKSNQLEYVDLFLEFPDDDISNHIEKILSIQTNKNFDFPFEKDCREVLEHIFKRKFYLELKEEIKSRKGVRTFVIKLNNTQVNDYDEDEKYNKFIRLCDDLNIENHDNSSSISNGDKASIIKDFFECLKII